MNFNQFIEWAFLGLMSGGVFILWRMNISISELNSKIGVILERTDRHENQLDKHDQRIRDLELFKQ